MHPSTLVEEFRNSPTWESCEDRLIDLLTTGHEVLDFKRRTDGFEVTLDGTAKPVLIPYRPPGQAQPAPVPLKASALASANLDSFETSETEPPPPPPPVVSRKPKPIVVPRPVKHEPGEDELMMSVGGLLTKYEKHVKEIVKFSLVHAGMTQDDIEKAVEDIAPKWVAQLKGQLPAMRKDAPEQ